MIYPMNFVSPVNRAYIINTNPSMAGITNSVDFEHNPIRDAKTNRNIPIPPNFILGFGFSMSPSGDIISNNLITE